MEIEILEQQCGGTEFVPRPHRLHLGAQNAEGVDRLQFILPAAWAGCTLALYLRRSDGVQLADQCHSHTVKTVARPEAVDQPELGTQQLCAAAQAGNGPGDNEAGQHTALHMDTIKAAGGHVIAHRPQLEAAAGPEQYVIQHQAHHHGDDKAPGHPPRGSVVRWRRGSSWCTARP